MTLPRSVSAIIPTRARPALLARALASVRAQDLPPREVIVVDDGDAREGAVPDVVAACGIASARVIANPRGRGASGARNAGAAVARGDILAFLDDDDEWLPAYLLRLAEVFQTRAADVVCTAFLHFPEGGELLGKRALQSLVAGDFFTRNPGLIGSNLAISRALYAAIGGFDETLPTSEDMDLGIRLSMQPNLRYAPLDEPLVRHHQHALGRLCTPRGDAMLAGVRRFYARYGARMTEAQRQAYRRNVRRFWGCDEHGQAA